MSQIERLDADYVTKDAAFHSIEAAGRALELSAITDPTVRQLYLKKISTGGKLASLPRINQVAAFAQEQGWPKIILLEF